MKNNYTTIACIYIPVTIAIDRMVFGATSVLTLITVSSPSIIIPQWMNLCGHKSRNSNYCWNKTVVQWLIYSEPRKTRVVTGPVPYR
jgi:hypothetical protein